MAKSVFSTPLITPFFRLLANGCLRILGWRVKAGPLPPAPFVVIGAPHTSNWDFLFLMCAIFHLRLDIKWMGKHTLFPTGLGWLMRWLGGIPVNRTRAHNMVGKMADLIKTRPDTILCIPPEGTRSAVREWKTGFYHIASKADVPVVLAAIDAERKELRVLGEFRPSGDIDSDLPQIKNKYSNIKGIRR
jgi:1-acyl-sn-glycerol-3-phosphate acyltransferase